MEQKVEKQASLEAVPVKRLKRELKYQGTILKMYEDTVEVNGHQAKWDFIHHDGAAAVLPVTEDGKILMVRQYRNALDRYTLEIPAGKLDSPDEAKMEEIIMIKAGIIGGAGYTAGELIRLLINHPDVDIKFINSSSNAGNKITDVHEGLYGETDLVFTDELPLDEIDVLFFCTAHGDTKKFMDSHNVPEDLKIIDLSMDYRIKSDDHGFIYGLPELNRRAICHSKHVANPGCFATCIQLGLLPLAKHLLLNEDIMVNAITGSTGAGVKPGATSHFSWRNNNMSIYKPFSHQHVPEIKQSLKQLQNSFNAEIDFIPYRGDFPRGIFATLVVKCKVELEELVKMYQDYYAEDSFVHIVDKNIDLKQVVNTNKCLIHLEKHGDKLLVISCIDNLLKGASGQAVHNMNLMFNLEETVGLRLKPSAF